MRTVKMTPEFKRILKVFKLNNEDAKLDINPFQEDIVSLDFGIYDDGKFFYDNSTNIFTKISASFDAQENKVIDEINMEIVDVDRLSFVVLVGSDIERIKAITNMYDHYTCAIERNSLYGAANKKNKTYLEKIRTLGVLSITWKNHTPMMSTNNLDLTYSLVK